jgi:23S rRNA (uracil1939-C5)-methyltransferase
MTQDLPETRRILRILDLGGHGDGIARLDDRTVFVDGALPGETVEAEVSGDRAQILRIIEPSVERQAPACRHFGTCGGCALQHMPSGVYADFKLKRVTEALRRQGVAHPPPGYFQSPPQSRRRAVLTVAGGPTDARIGFHGRRSHALAEIAACPVLEPAIEARLEDIAALGRIILTRKGALQAHVVATPSGVDLAFSGADPRLSADRRALLAERALALGFCRISLNGETLAVARRPEIRAGRARIIPPPGGFLQAVDAAQSVMTRFALETCAGAQRALDLFAGAGTFTLPMAESASVHAVESDRASLAALTEAARAASGLKPVTTERRCLFRQPLKPAELQRFDAVICDPPRAGAEAQSALLAASGTERLCMVSCNPVTFARDLRILAAGGFRIRRLLVVDQFLWSPHVEILADLTRAAADGQG